MAQAIPFTHFQTQGVDTKNRSLRYDMNAMADFEQVTGMGLARLMSTSAVFATTRALLWAGLKHNNRALTIEVVGSLMQEYTEKDGDINDLLKACLEACVIQKAVPNLKLAIDPDAEDDAEPAPNAKPQTSSSPTTGTTTDSGQATSVPPSPTPTAVSN